MGIIHKVRYVTRFGQDFTLVLVESVANDVAVYEMKGIHHPTDVAAHGIKYSERDAKLEGFEVPEGKHYRR